MNRRHSGALISGLVALLPLAFGIPATPPPPPGAPFAVIAYYGGRGRGLEDLPAGKLTHIIYSFLHLRGDSLSLDGPRDSAAIAALVSLKRKNPQLKVMLSLGGWGGCAPCSETFESPHGRSIFAASTLRVLARTGTDGIDIDWEYPVVE
ncbi:MAG TPA: glycosyl hydrolase family 18 protein, partial [Bacteroidota bacterium]|nr:glycosyl hydrolase family 18 protein [Bacteroidota bacterium]